LSRRPPGWRLSSRAVRGSAGAVALVTLALVSGCGGRGPVATPAVEPLVLGTLVPLNGSLRQFGAAESAGIALAVQQINAAGGVLGQQVVRVEGDSGDAYTNIASQTVDRELARKVTAIVGATGSSVTVEVVDKIVGAGVVSAEDVRRAFGVRFSRRDGDLDPSDHAGPDRYAHGQFDCVPFAVRPGAPDRPG